jgi:hypothetical protein
MDLHDNDCGHAPHDDDTYEPAFELTDGSLIPNHGEIEDLPDLDYDPEIEQETADDTGDWDSRIDEPESGDREYEGLESVMQQVAERDALVEAILDEIDEHVGSLDGRDLRALGQILRSPDMTPDALRQLHERGILMTQAKGMAFDRMHRSPGHAAAPVTPGGMQRQGGLSREELQRIHDLAPRLRVPVEELKAQYIARKRMNG